MTQQEEQLLNRVEEASRVITKLTKEVRPLLEGKDKKKAKGLVDQLIVGSETFWQRLRILGQSL